MSSTSEIKDKIDKFAEIDKIILSMKAIASINVQQAQLQIENIRLYQKEIKKSLDEIYSLFPEIILETAKGEKLYIVWGSDQGLCGNFNNSLSQKANSISETEKNINGFILIGKRLKNDFTGRLIDTLNSPSDINSIHSYAGNLIKDILEIYSTGKIEEIYLVYSLFKGIGSYETQIQKVIPFIPEHQLIDDIPLVDMKPQDLLKNVLFEYIYSFIYQAYLDSFLSENGVRLMNMNNASKNMEEKTKQLEIENNYFRQEEITAEMLGIISSYQILTEN